MTPTVTPFSYDMKKQWDEPVCKLVTDNLITSANAADVPVCWMWENRNQRTEGAGRSSAIRRALGHGMLSAIFIALAAFLPAGSTQTLQMGVVGAAPENELLLAAAVAAGSCARPASACAAAASPAAFAEPREPLAVPAQICSQAREGVQASVGARGAAEAAARAGLALLLAEPAPRRRPLAALELFPHPDVLAQACADLCAAKGWRNAVLLHEGGADAAPLMAPDHERLALRARLLPPPHDRDALRNLLLVLKRWGATQFVVWCAAECSVRVLDAAQRAGLLAERHSFLLPALDLHTLALADYSYGGANLTGLQLFDPASEDVRAAMRAWSEEYGRRVGAAADRSATAQVERNPPPALLLSYDAARIVAEAAEHLQLPEQPRGDCARGVAAFHADTLLNFVRSREWTGVTGPMSWEGDGARRDVSLRVVEVARGGRLASAGSWSPRLGLRWRERPPAPAPPRDLMANRTFVVLIAKSDPYVMRQQSAERLSGNARYEGFCIELIERLARQLGFNYTFVQQPHDAYGTRDKASGRWSGMMGRLMHDENIHFAVTDLTITAEREEAVDFTTPFMNLGISILIHKPQPPKPALLAFLLPFSNEVWLCLGLAYLGTSLVLYVVGRLCPEEWQNPYPCIEEPPALENQFTLANALWFNLGAVLQQGSEIAPVAYGSRAVASVWWLFALVITSSYTANLATLLSSKTANEPIKNVRDLAENDQGIEYGAKAGGSTYTFFEQSTNELYRRMYQTMKEQEMPKTNAEGIKKVMSGKYAFFAESTTIEYTTERNCEVTRVGDLLDSKGYGIAMKKNSTYRHLLNLALLNLQEGGVLRDMKHRWWKEMHGGGACQESEEYGSEELSMNNFIGLFAVLTVGCILGVIVSCCDLARAAWLHPRDPRCSFAASFMSELRFVFRVDRSVKPVRGRLTPPPASPAASSRSNLTAGSADRSPRAASRPSSRPPSRPPSRRRSSMHAASVRRARHASSPFG